MVSGRTMDLQRQDVLVVYELNKKDITSSSDKSLDCFNFVLIYNCFIINFNILFRQRQQF